MANVRELMLAIILAWIVSSCSHPAAPPAPDAVTVSGPTSGYLNVSCSFKASINFGSQAELIYKWVFTDTTILGIGLDSIARSFVDTGRQIFLVHVIRTGDNTELCSANDTVTIFDTTTPPPNPNDTSSHNFTWSVYTNVNGENNMTGCCVFEANDIYAVNGDLHHFDGTSWSTITVQDVNGTSYQGALSGNSIFGFTDNDFWLTNGSGTIHYLGNGRAQGYSLYYLTHAFLHSAWGTSSNNMYLVGDSGTIIHFDGTTWTKMNSGTTKELNSISGTSDNDIWAAGYNISTGESELVHFDGTSWTKDSLSLTALTENWGINGVYAGDSAGHRTAAISGWTIFRRTDRASWRSDSGLVPNDIGGRIWMSGICGNNPNDLLGTGDGGLIVHWNGRSWRRYDQVLAVGDNTFIHSGASLKGNTACIVGMKDGTSWVLVGQRQ